MMQKQKRPTEIAIIGIVSLIIGIIRLLIGLGLITSFVSLSDMGVDISGIEAKTVDAISLYVGAFDLTFSVFCFITALSTFKGLRWAWNSNKALSMVVYATGFLSFKGGDYIDGIIAVVLSTVIISLIYTKSVKEYLRKLDRA